MVDLFNKQGPLDKDELVEFVENYKKNGRPNYQDTIDLGESVDSRVERMVNHMGKTMGNITDRLALTIIELSERKPTQHAGDCTVYSSLINDTPESGVCTCGYGISVIRENGDHRELYSNELMEKLMCVGGNI